MFSKNKATTDAEAREQYEYARERITKKKNLVRHFIFFLAGSILFIVLDVVLKLGHELLMKDWYIWVILIWAFILMIHFFNVFILNKFMGKEWQDKQLEKLKAAQEVRISELKKQAIQEVTVAEVKKLKEEALQLEQTAIKKNEAHPNQLPEENE